ncbi:glycosyltransferase [Clostridium botulinum]|uniref:glycosyltransferase n=1 Tax=Clostridium botulinum TaxID=1491 RepID=UPI0013FF6B3F|nr:glycosyltransferase [Clostridium botulinum]MBN1073450.1 glycosyltransferase [Clostridium botulinum]NFN14998.1 glycosyltransferase [Clostridium botulinum]
MDKNEIKEIIKSNINNIFLEEAEEIILQYKKIFEYDDEIASMDAIISIYRENYDEAMSQIREGLKYNIYSSDLYYTMGNLYEIKGKYENAYLCYEQALKFNEKDNEKVILQNINRLKKEHNIKVNNYSIIILTYNQLEYTKVCIDSIKKYNGNENCEIIIIDNHSTDGTVEWIKNQKGIKYILNEDNKGFPVGCNQGIELSKKDNDIFLLNNDTVIMPNSIFNLRMGLYSDENIGATGSISNSVSYYQQISQQYEDFNGYMNFALSNNITNNKAYDPRVKLVGFAMLIKRNVLDQVGLLDERFTPGNYEDDDLSLRIIVEGYKLLLCKDSYIHHFGSVSFRENADKYNELLSINSNKFKEKWGNTSENIFGLRYDLVDKIDKSILNLNKQINILDLGCGIGGTLLAIKELLPNAKLYGVEEDKKIVDIVNKSKIEVKIANTEDIDFSNLIFDIILISKNNMNKYIEYLKQNINCNSQIVMENELKNQENIQFTGERLVINDFVRDNYSDVMEEHLSRYKLASKYVKDKIVIDAASGSGYGTMILAKAGAKNVNGFDISKEAVYSAIHNYREYKNIRFDVGDVTKLNVVDESIDVFVSFETIEHINSGADLIKEASRVLKDEGIFIVSTPNRNATNPGLLFEEKPQNKYHSFEYSPLEFIGNLSYEFDIVELYGQTVNENIEFAKNKYMRKIFGKTDLDYLGMNNIKDYECRKITEFKNFEPMYLVAVCVKKAKKNKYTYSYKNEIYSSVKNQKNEENGSVKFYELANGSCLGEGFNINNINAVSIGNNVVIKDGCWLNDCIPIENQEAKIIIEDGCSIGSRFSISVSNRCIIERNVIIGPNVYIADCEHNYKSIGIPIMNQGITSTTNTVIVGENSWIGINSTIIGNVKIGKGCVVGANSYVTKTIPDYSVVGGSPAKILKMYDTVTQKWVRVRNKADVERIINNRKKQPLISICIPTFNRAMELEKCLHSIFKQIGNDGLFEILISNNNSEDNTEEIVKKYELLYDNITYNKNIDNIGGDNNIALVTKKAKGKYIMLHGDDDYFKDDTIYKLLNIINNNQEKSLFFINVLSCDNKVEECNGINEFLKKSSINSGFISSIIMKRQEYEKVKEPFKFIDSGFNQIYLQYMILLKNPKCLIVNSPIFIYEGNKPQGYNFGKVFIKNYLDILNYIKDYGLNEEVIKEEKLKIIQTTILPWYKNIIENKIDIDISGFYQYFYEYYKEESYFKQVSNTIEEIRRKSEL